VIATTLVAIVITRATVLSSTGEEREDSLG
jgi:hypothetical protein